MLPVAATLILLITIFEINGSNGFLEYRPKYRSWMSRRMKCRKEAEEAFLTFVKTFKSNYSRITRNILKLISGFVSVFLSSFML